MGSHVALHLQVQKFDGEIVVVPLGLAGEFFSPQAATFLGILREVVELFRSPPADQLVAFVADSERGLGCPENFRIERFT